MTKIEKVKIDSLFNKKTVFPQVNTNNTSAIKANKGTKQHLVSILKDKNILPKKTEVLPIDEPLSKKDGVNSAESERQELLNKKYPNINKDGLKIIDELKVGDNTIVGATSDENYSKIYLYDKYGLLIGSVKVPKNGNISSISYNDKTGEICISIDGETINYKLDIIKKSINNNSKYILPDYKSEAYQQQLKKVIDLYNQADGVAADTYIEEANDTFRNVGCGTASLIIAYAMLSGKLEFNPVEFIQDAVNQGYLTQFGNDSTMLPIEGPENIIRNKWNLDINEIESNKEDIIQSLKEGKKVMFNVTINNGTYNSSNGHYVLLDHYDEETDQIFVVDPAARPGYKDPNRTGYHSVNFLESELFSIPNNPPVEIEYTGPIK
ncbi:MAG: C39 family peptidase [Bacilli bacterium]|nr:C39 family peptidase [Bacilli bacterium]